MPLFPPNLPLAVDGEGEPEGGEVGGKLKKVKR
jgi:hypothetical protein